MKFKKLLISASAIAAGSGLLATVLTSCAKASVDDKLKITLNDEGLLYDPANMKDTNGYKLSFAEAIEYALTRSNNWAQFKNALAEEIVFKWFENRMAPSKDSDQKNENFRVSYDEWVYQIDKDYNDTVQNCKNKYGANWQFYLQNEYLAPLGGTEAAYKHAKLVDKVKADFISKVFAKSYFGYKSETTVNEVYPHIYDKATKNIDRLDLNKPENWGKLGFFARAEVSFDPGTTPHNYDEVSVNSLARHPDGDYAAIQDYVFNRWFKTEKPFFADAALFKYSNPKNVAHGKLEEIYDGARTEVKIPTDKPSEAFPFFGAGNNSGTFKANEFLKDLKAGKFATLVDESAAEKEGNGTVTIKLADTDDSQTCLLVTGKDMFTALYTPYSMACGSLYGQMMGLEGYAASANTLTQAQVEANFAGFTGEEDDFRMLKNFFYTYNPGSQGTGEIKTITKFLDLNSVYGGVTADGYHCPLFQDCPTYKYFYGGEDGKNGVRYIANTIQVPFESTNNKLLPSQPWVMELNEAGVHCLTIDGYNYVNKGADETAKLENLKKVVMYRLMQKQNNDLSAPCISADILGDKGKLKTYFNDNFANIVLEMATYQADTSLPAAEQLTLNAKYNVFRSVESYKTNTPTKKDNLFLNIICDKEKFGSTYENLVKYLQLLDQFEEIKKTVSSLETANNKIYSYRSKQITNSKSTKEYAKTIYENGLLTPFAYTPSTQTNNKWLHDYASLNRVILEGDYKNEILNTTGGATAALKTRLTNIGNSDFVKEVKANAKVNGDTGFSPQITKAKNSTSNRFWYSSALADKIMYSFMGNKANSVNAIKMNAYKYYSSQHHGDWFDSQILTGSASKNAFYTTYARSKVLTGDKNLAYYANTAGAVADATAFYSLMNSSFEDFKQKAENEGGIHADDLANYELFKATVMYLMASDKTEAEGGKPFDNFYTVLNSKIGDDETAIVGYLTRGYTIGADSDKLSEDPIDVTSTTDYDFKADVDNMFDKHNYVGKSTPEETASNSKLTTSSYWNVVQRTYNVSGTEHTKDFAGFLGLQTKASNQLDSASGLQAAVFNEFAKATIGAKNIEATEAYKTNAGCWFQFAGSCDSKGNPLTIPDLTVGSTTYKVSDWFKDQYAPVRKIAKKIVEYKTPDDLRSLAGTLAASFGGRSDFIDIANGTSTFESTEAMQYKMLCLLPSSYSECEAKGCIHWFQRVKNVEVHTPDLSMDIVFKDNSGKNSYKLLATQLNKADALEKTITPKWDTNKWVMENAESPITPEEFWVIFMNLAAESTVQQRAVTEVVKCAFGDKKLIVYDAQLYNQFDSVWIKDWSKKTMGA